MRLPKKEKVIEGLVGTVLVGGTLLFFFLGGAGIIYAVVMLLIAAMLVLTSPIWLYQLIRGAIVWLKLRKGLKTPDEVAGALARLALAGLGGLIVAAILRPIVYLVLTFAATLLGPASPVLLILGVIAGVALALGLEPKGGKKAGGSVNDRVVGCEEEDEEDFMTNLLRDSATIREPADEGPAGCKAFIGTINIPRLSETFTEGTVSLWLNKEGDAVDKYDTLLYVDTDQDLYEFPSPFTGRLTKILANEDAIVKVGDPLCEIRLAQAPAAAGGQTNEARAPGPQRK